MSDDKPVLDGLFSEQAETPEGKYLVLRRDDTVPKWPWFVLGARDPAAAWALWFYSWVAWLYGMNRGYCQGCARKAKHFAEYRKQYGVGDPDMGRHRPDDPAVIARMREGNGS